MTFEFEISDSSALDKMRALHESEVARNRRFYPSPGAARLLTRGVRRLAVTVCTAAVSLTQLRGIAPGCTGDLSSEEFVRRLRDEEW